MKPRGGASAGPPTTFRPASAPLTLVATCTMLPLAACAVMGGGGQRADMVVDCDVLRGDTLAAATVAQADMPRLLNEAEVRERLEWLMLDGEGRRTQVQLLVQPSGSVSHGCVPAGSGNLDFDRAALEAAREARFQPATRGGEAVPAWVTFWLGLG